MTLMGQNQGQTTWKSYYAQAPSCGYATREYYDFVYEASENDVILALRWSYKIKLVVTQL